jgi:hypothetical protein
MYDDEATFEISFRGKKKDEKWVKMNPKENSSSYEHQIRFKTPIAQQSFSACIRESSAQYSDIVGKYIDFECIDFAPTSDKSGFGLYKLFLCIEPRS